MLAGHVGVAIAAKRYAPALNLGWLACAALFPDMILWPLSLAGIERVILPADPSLRRYLTFLFPYSHSLLATLLYALLFTGVAALRGHRKAAILLGGLVLSHFVLDALVHIPELTLAGQDTMRFGTSLEDRPPVALSLEAVLTLAALAVYWPVRRTPVMILTVVVLLLTIGGTLFAPLPESEIQAAAGPLLTNLVILALLAWFDRTRPHPRELLR